VDSVVPGFAGVDEPVEFGGALGVTDEIVFANFGVLLAGRAYGARHAGGSGSGDAADAGYLYGFCGE